MAEILRAVLPPAVTWVETRDDRGADELFPEEAAVVAKAVAKRQAEFATVRWCARQALARLGVTSGPIVPGERGAPSWPAGVVGSMTHCLGYRAAAVARRGEVTSIGVDAEPAAPLPDGVLEAIARPAETEMLARLAAREPGIHWDRLLFSAKESVYKAWFPVAGTFLEFHEAELVVDPAAGTFTARLLQRGPFLELGGRWTQTDGVVATSVVVLSPSAPAGSA
ncbi:4'-phosphopantetheinyl transferase superfamily protein [Actinoplanes sp. LDG1-06]|uniref:4'-phosphopantetheinyl transferase superfamily protein n=1 Tax=Paractinoplanes ovalisporus TaxID=2810368 RepID=A0ABS2AIK9_9ACTN|nr:4'-phosphopantetheinyl transferase superfamily protein [Actinoplanes ovalisporus]MBM2619661.1 4'-phosphopantetheinyl transferase superfamily protein [Actinoplanes ovalisporus]